MINNEKPLYALTLRRPWPLAICRVGKRVENRTWAPPVALVGQWLAIHAGKGFERESARAIAEGAEGFPCDEKAHPMGIVALAKLADVVTNPNELDPIQRMVWWMGPIGWLIDDVVVLETPVVAKGKQGLWLVDNAAKELCRVQCGLARIRATKEANR